MGRSQQTGTRAMNTIVEQAQQGTITKGMQEIAQREGRNPHELCEAIAAGSAVIMQRGERYIGIGKGLDTKVNVNLGTSSSRVDIEKEIQKALIAEKFGADTISELSMGGDIPAIRNIIRAHTTLPLTTVPVYQAVAEHGLKNMTADDILSTLRMQAEEGISSLVIHCVNHEMLAEFQRKKRLLGIVSKGGSITSAFMVHNHCENPFIEHFEDVISICRQHDIVLSLGNTARSGCIHDRRDRMQLIEIRQNVELAHRAHSAGVQVIIEGAGGHIRNDRIRSMVQYYRKRTPFPLFVAGPLPTDIAVGYDHIAGAVGASTASAAGADYLCYITPAEHLGLPGPEAVKEGLIAFRIAAHIGDTVKYGRENADTRMARLRADLNREGQIRCSLDPQRARDLSDGDPVCTMCGEYCAIRIMREL